MKTIITLLIAIALALSTSSWASRADCSRGERIGNDLIMVGDSEREVIEAEPDRTVRLETRQGGAAGFRHDFYLRGATVQVYVQAGQVVRICRIRD